jgi:hypothetical protein
MHFKGFLQMSKYPAQIDNSQNLPLVVDNLTPIRGAIFNKLRNAVIAIESVLGTQPAGTYTNVKSRLETIENITGNLEIIKLNKDLGGDLNNPTVIGIQGYPVSTIPPALNNALIWNGISWSPTALPETELPPGTYVGETLVWNGTAFSPDFIYQDSLYPVFTQSLTSDIVLVEVGSTITNPTFTASYTELPLLAELTDNMFNTPLNVTTTPTLFNSNNNFTKNNYGDTVIFTLVAVQRNFTKTATHEIQWGQKVYYGTDIAGQLGESFIKGLNNQLTNTKDITLSFTVNAGNKIYYACRSAYGDMTFSVNNMSGGFTKVQTISLTNDFGFTENYDLYESDYAGLGSLVITIN